MRRFFPFVAAIALAAAAIPARVQDAQGPIAPPPKYEVKNIPLKADPGKPPLPPEEMIRKLAANEDAFKKAYDTYRFEQTVRVQEIGDSGSSGEFIVTGEFYTKPDGKRYERIVKPPESSLRGTAFSLEDVQTLAKLPLFVLTTDELPQYDLTYEGQQKLDEINTLIFGVKPKQVLRGRRLFEGVVWIDDQELAVVKSYGKFVTEVTGDGEQFPFTTYETYRENIAGKYWFPTYIRSDDIVPLQKGGELHLRLVIRSSNFQLQTATAPTPTAAPAIPAVPKPPQ
jgi:hypothetical protein